MEAANIRSLWSRLGNSRAEVFLVCVFSGALILQCFIPPFIGIANNGDFSKVCMQFCLGPADGWGTNFQYFVSDYVRENRYCWYSRMRVTEAGVAAITIGAARRFGWPDRFDIRWQGAAHALLFVLAFWLFVRLLRPLGWTLQTTAGLVAVWILADVRYASYMNSFYMDASGLVAFLLAVITAVYALHTGNILWVLAFSGLEVAYAMSKSPHAASAVLGAALPLALMPRPQPIWRRLVLGFAAVVILAGVIESLAVTPNTYRGQALYNVVFYRILGDSQDPKSDAVELGVKPDELRYTGTYAYLPESPGRSNRWIQAFYERTGFTKLLLFYARHPKFVLEDLASDLKWAAPQMRAPNVANLRRDDGYPPGSLSNRFDTWTGLRSAVFSWLPAHVLVWYSVLTIGAILLIRRRPEWARMAALLIGLVLAAAIEFGVASLADAVETDRHLYIFHAITDVTVIFSAVTVAALWNVRSITQPAEVVVAGQNAY